MRNKKRQRILPNQCNYVIQSSKGDLVVDLFENTDQFYCISGFPKTSQWFNGEEFGFIAP